MHIPRVVGSFLLRPSVRSRTSRIHMMSKDGTQTPQIVSSLPNKKHKMNIKYDLYRGHPNMGLLPRAEMESIMSDFIQEGGEHEIDTWRRYLNYGANAGDERFLLALRSFLDRRTKDDDMGDSAKQNVLERELFITNGVSHGLELLCATLTQPGDEVWVERPTYFLAPKIFESNGIIVKPLPMMSDRSEFEGNKGD